jgi:hypothetical protein
MFETESIKFIKEYLYAMQILHNGIYFDKQKKFYFRMKIIKCECW